MKKLGCKGVDYAVPKTRVNHTISFSALRHEHTEHLVSNLFGYVEQKDDLKNACDHPMYV